MNVLEERLFIIPFLLRKTQNALDSKSGADNDASAVIASAQKNECVMRVCIYMVQFVMYCSETACVYRRVCISIVMWGDIYPTEGALDAIIDAVVTPCCRTDRFAESLKLLLLLFLFYFFVFNYFNDCLITNSALPRLYFVSKRLTYFVALLNLLFSWRACKLSKSRKDCCADHPSNYFVFIFSFCWRL